jgi:maleate isomerase
LPIADDSSPDEIIAMAHEDGIRAIYHLASCRPHAIAYGCTASSILQGHASDVRLARHITVAQATTATDSVFAACRARLAEQSTAVELSGCLEPID